MGLPMRVGFWAAKNNLTKKKKLLKTKKQKLLRLGFLRFHSIKSTERGGSETVFELVPFKFQIFVLWIEVCCFYWSTCSFYSRFMLLFSKSMLLYVHFCHWFWTMLLSCLISVACVGVYSSLPFASWTLFVLSSNLIQKKNHVATACLESQDLRFLVDG